jgi:peptide/nickel transport system substrate-binding protein
VNTLLIGRRSLGALALAVVAAIVLAACGSSNNSGGSSSGGSSSGGGGKAGGAITILGLSYPDYLDPALSYTVDGWQALTQVYPGLLTFPHKSGAPGAKVAPALAEAMPTISPDQKTYKFKLRKGLKFSDGTPLKASDFKASIERVLKTDSQGVGLGYTNIVGGEQLLKTKKGDITGIKVNDATGDITINLVKPRGAFTYELAIPFAGIVPKSTPASNQTKKPPPGAGRYRIVNVNVNRSYQLVRNTNFSPVLKGTAVDAGKVNQITLKIVRSAANAATMISQNKADFMIDNPPADRIGDIKAKYANRYRQFPTSSTFYFFMNAEVKPFNNLDVRRAVNYAIDPDAINRIQGGVIQPSNTIIPKGIPGHEDTPNLYPHNMAKAKALVKKSGLAGTPITVWGDPEDPTKPTVEYYADVLNQLGFKAKTKIISAETYFATTGDRSVHAQTGWANWFQDYPHPADFVDVLVNPDKVVATGNNNYSYNASDHKLAAEINAVSAKQITPATEKEWAAIDQEIQRKAYWGIYGTRKQSTFMSERMDFDNCKGDNWPVGTHDWAQFCLK